MVARLTVTLTCLFPPRLPLAGEILSQDWVLTMLQARERLLWLVSTKVCDVTLNGPPIGPDDVKPMAGETSNGWLSSSVKVTGCTAWEVLFEKIRLAV